MIWKFDADEIRKTTQENATHKNSGKTTKRKTQKQMDIPNQKGYRNKSGKLGRNTGKAKVGEQRQLETSL